MGTEQYGDPNNNHEAWAIKFDPVKFAYVHFKCGNHNTTYLQKDSIIGKLPHFIRNNKYKTEMNIYVHNGFPGFLESFKRGGLDIYI